MKVEVVLPTELNLSSYRARLKQVVSASCTTRVSNTKQLMLKVHISDSVADTITFKIMFQTFVYNFILKNEFIIHFNKCNE